MLVTREWELCYLRDEEGAERGTFPHDIFLGKKDSCKFFVEIRAADLVQGIQSHGRRARRSSAIFNLKGTMYKVLVCVCVS